MEKGLDDIFNEALNETTDASPAPEAPSGRPASGGTGPTRPDATINTNIPLRADATAAQIQERINVLEKKFIDGKKRVAEIKEIALSGKAPSMALTLANEQQSLDVTLANLPAQIEALKKKYAQRLASETPTTPTPEPAPSPLEPPTPDSANIKKEALEQKIAVIDKRIDTALKKIEAVTAQGVERSKRLDDATSKLDAFNELLARVQSRRAELEKPPTPALPAEILAIPEAMRPITMRDGSTLEINRV